MRPYLNCKYSPAKSRSRAKTGEDVATMAQSVSLGEDVKFDGARLNEYQIKVSLNRSVKLLAVCRQRGEMMIIIKVEPAHTMR